MVAWSCCAHSLWVFCWRRHEFPRLINPSARWGGSTKTRVIHHLSIYWYAHLPTYLPTCLPVREHLRCEASGPPSSTPRFVLSRKLVLAGLLFDCICGRGPVDEHCLMYYVPKYHHHTSGYVFLSVSFSLLTQWCLLDWWTTHQMGWS